jgi:imidazolonepropionase-like amidohydrolase
VIGAGTFAQTPAPRHLALVGGMLLDGYDVPPLHHAAVIVRDNRIVWVGTAADAEIPAGATVIDTSSRVMMPGLIDLHAHLVILGHGNYGEWFPWMEKRGLDRTLAEVMTISARQLLMAGVTSAVDLGGPLGPSLAVRDQAADGRIPGPRLWMSGPWLARRVGVFPPEYQVEITSPAQAGKEVDRLAKAGVDIIKAHAGLTRLDYDAIVAAARRHGLPVHAHVYGEQDVRNALEAGVDVLTHAGSAGTAPPYSDAMIRDIVNAGRPVVVTAAHRSWVYPDTVGFPERLQDPQFRRGFPPDMYDEVQRSLANWHALPYFQRTDREVFFRVRGLGQFIEAGAVLGIGTDSGTPMNFHTEALWREVKAHVDLGMPPQRALSAATRIGARILGRGRDLGTIEPGKLADIIVINGNPLFDIQSLAHVEVVIKDGVIHRGGPQAARQPSGERQ